MPRAVSRQGTRSLIPLLPRAATLTHELLAVNGDAERTKLICYSWTGLDSELADRAAGAPLIRLVGLEELYG